VNIRISMTRPRFILTPEQINARPVLLCGSDAHHCHTLRLQVNDQVYIADGRQKEYVARIVRFLKHAVELELLEPTGRDPESFLPITLYQGFVRGSKLDLVIQKTTELGIRRLVPVISTYSQMKSKPEREGRLERWREIARQAVRQSGRIQLPEIALPCTFVQSLSQISKSTVGIILSENPTANKSWKNQLARISSPQTVAIWVGPEGGFTAEEIAMARERGIHSVNLGPRILRSETAGIVAVSLAQFIWGDLGGR